MADRADSDIKQLAAIASGSGGQQPLRRQLSIVAGSRAAHVRASWRSGGSTGRALSRFVELSFRRELIVTGQYKVSLEDVLLTAATAGISNSSKLVPGAEGAHGGSEGGGDEGGGSHGGGSHGGGGEPDLSVVVAQLRPGPRLQADR
jgi:hypothetical protein